MWLSGVSGPKNTSKQHIKSFNFRSNITINHNSCMQYFLFSQHLLHALLYKAHPYAPHLITGTSAFEAPLLLCMVNEYDKPERAPNSVLPRITGVMESIKSTIRSTSTAVLSGESCVYMHIERGNKMSPRLRES